MTRKRFFAHHNTASFVFFAIVAACFFSAVTRAQQPDTATVVRMVDAAAKNRMNTVAQFTVAEHYSVYRKSGGATPVSEMTVKSTYKKEAGKHSTVVAQSGSSVVRALLSGTVIDLERRINQPSTRAKYLFNSVNYDMKLKPGGPENLYGRFCYLLSIKPRLKVPGLLDGTLWVDAKDGSIVQVEGTAVKNPAALPGSTQVMRQYAKLNGVTQETYTRIVSNNSVIGPTIVTIDYHDYQVQLHLPG